MSEETKLSDVGLTHVALPVADLERSVGFYASYAAMQVVHRREGVVWLSDRTRPFVIVLIESRASIDPLRPVAHLGVACGSREDVDTLCRRARDEDVLVTGPCDYGPPVGYWAFLRDPDGHTLEVSHGQEVGLLVSGKETDAASGSAQRAGAPVELGPGERSSSG